MVVVFYRFLWIAIHSAYTFLYAALQLASYLYVQVIRWWKWILVQQKQEQQEPIRRHTGISTDIGNSRHTAELVHKQNQHLIESCKVDLCKIPKHILIIFGEEMPEFEFMANFIMWSIFTGINYISFYDHKDNFCTKTNDTFKLYLQAKTNQLNISWNFDSNRPLCTSGQISYKNGLTRSLTVNFLNSSHGFQQISQICRSLCESPSIDTKSIDIDYLNRKMSERWNHLPDPDLALYFGDVCCTYGAMPWHIRLTEFFNSKSQYGFSIKTFLRAMYSFSKCEQRFGK